MDAAAFPSQNVLGFSMAFSFSKQCYLGNSYMPTKEVAAQPSTFALQKAFSPINNTSIRSDGHKGGKTSRRNEGKKPKTFDGKQSMSPHKEDIIALIKQIRVSISKGYSPNTGKRSSNGEKDKPSTESNRDKPKKQVKAIISTRANGNHLSNKITLSRKDQETQEQPHLLGLKLTRPPSNFVRRSPIPFLSPQRGNFIELSNNASPAFMLDTNVQTEKLGELRLADLKELAKSRGVKGYSKLKKVELIKILGS